MKNPSDGTDEHGGGKTKRRLFKTISDGTGKSLSDDWQPGNGEAVQLKVKTAATWISNARLGIRSGETGSINNEGNAFKAV